MVATHNIIYFQKKVDSSIESSSDTQKMLRTRRQSLFNADQAEVPPAL